MILVRVPAALVAAFLMLCVLPPMAAAGRAADITREMSFRASEGDLGQYGSITDFASVDIVHETDVATLAAVFPSGKPTIYHVAFASGKPVRCPDVFDGHWLYRRGTLATAPIDAAAVSIEVAPGASFLEGGDVVLYARDVATAEPDWTVVEHAEVTSVTGDELALSRSAPVDWTAIVTDSSRELVVVPHATMDGAVVEGDVDLWAFNVSTVAPLDASSKTGWKAAAECFFDGYWMHSSFGGQAIGVEFDSARWRFDTGGAYPEDVDVDNDLAADYGMPGGDAVWGRGGTLYLEEVRALLGGATVQLDSSLPSIGWRSFAVVDGIEMENFPSGDNWGRFSEAFQHLATWTDRARGTEAPFSYPVTKDDTATWQCDLDVTPAPDMPEPVGDARFRIGLASALMVGMPHAYAAEDDTTGEKCFDLYPWDEYSGGALADHDWLGYAKGKARRSSSDVNTTVDLMTDATTSVEEHPQADQPADAYMLLGTAPSADALDRRMAVLSVPTVADTAAILAQTGVHYPAPQGAWIEYNLVPKPAEDHAALEYSLVLTTSAQVGSASPRGTERSVPRLLRVKLFAGVSVGEDSEGVPEIEERVYRQDLLVPRGGSHTFTLTFRVDANHDGNPPSVVKLRFESGEETGWVRVRPRLYPGSSDRWLRSFSGGMVLLNRSDSDWTPTLSGAKRSTSYCTLDGESVDLPPTVPADDALFLRRCMGTGLLP
jgi:hypothetical protein